MSTGPDAFASAAAAATARWIAAVRERETARHDRLFHDPWAGLLAGDAGRQMMAASERASGGRNDFIPIRTRWFEDLVLRQAPVVRQVVLLGAGFDTRAFRMDLPQDLDWFELDSDELLAEKIARLGVAGAEPRCRRRAVAADLDADWPAALAAAGFRDGVATLWIAEGFLFYLTPATVAAALSRACQLAGAGSSFAADVSGSGLLRTPGIETYVARRATIGLPPPFASDDPVALWQSAGWSIVELFEPGRLAREYGRPIAPVPDAGRTRAADPSMRSYFVVGRVPA